MGNYKEIEIILRVDFNDFIKWFFDIYETLFSSVINYINEEFIIVTGMTYPGYGYSSFAWMIYGQKVVFFPQSSVQPDPVLPFPGICIELLEITDYQLTVKIRLEQKEMQVYYQLFLLEIANTWPESKEEIEKSFNSSFGNMVEDIYDIFSIGNQEMKFFGTPYDFGISAIKYFERILPVHFPTGEGSHSNYFNFQVQPLGDDDKYPEPNAAFVEVELYRQSLANWFIGRKIIMGNISAQKMHDGYSLLRIEDMKFKDCWEMLKGELEKLKWIESEAKKDYADSVEERRKGNMPTMKEVITVVGETLSCLEKPTFRIETEELGENFQFNIYKHDEYVGTYRIKPGQPGGSIQHTDDPELIREWYKIVEFVHGDLQRKFGKFPWGQARVNIEIQKDENVTNELVAIAEGKWSDSFNTFEAGLNDFSEKNMDKSYGKYLFKFAIMAKSAFSKQSMKCWMVGVHDHNRELLMTVPQADGLMGPEGGWPYGEITAREIVGGLKIEINTAKNHATIIYSYINELVTKMKTEGLEIKEVDNSTGGEIWEKIPDKGWDRMALKLWLKGHTASEIAQRVHVSNRRVTNRITELRKIYGTDNIPYKNDILKKLREKQ